MFISPAFADTAAAVPQQGSFLVSLAPLVIIFVFFYLLVLRPQGKKIRDHQTMLHSLKAGDKVVTAGGLYATVVKVSDHDVTLEIASGVHVKAQKHTVSGMQEMPLPANDKGSK